MNKKKKIGISGVFFLAVLLVLAIIWDGQAAKEIPGYTAVFFDVFDTRTDILAFCEDEEIFTEQAARLKEKLEHYHRLYNIYEDYEGINNIKTINDNAGIAPVEVSREIIDLLLFSKEMYTQTGGQMNIAMGSVLKIWHDYREAGLDEPENATLPPMEELQAAAEYCNINQMIIDEEAMTVYLPDKNMSLDVGSIGKGYAVQRVAEYAKEIGMDSVLLSVGCNICAVGTKPDGSAWNVGIQNPDLDSEELYLEIVSVADACVVTSGDYQRYYEVDGERYCHIIDGDTLMPANYFSSVAIVTTDSGRADALSTAIFNMTFEDGLAFVEDIEDVEAIWILNDGSIHYSEGFERYLAD